MKWMGLSGSTREESESSVFVLFGRELFYRNVVPAVLARGSMRGRFWPIVNTILFTVLVPGTVAVLLPRSIIGGFRTPRAGAMAWIGSLAFFTGAAIYFRCAWEFAVRGLGTPAPIAPTMFLVTTALHRYVRNPMYLGVALA